MAHGAAVVGGASQVDWFRSVNHLTRATPWLHGPAVWFAEYGVAVFAALLLASWWLARRDGDLRRTAAALWAPVGVLLALALNQLLVAWFAEPRPYTAWPAATVLVHRSADASFPSDHAVMAGAVAAGVLLVDRRLGLVACALAVLMAATRVYVGAHFPLDVVAGLAVGSVIAVASYAVVRPVVARLVVLLSETPVRPLLTSQPAGSER